MGMSWEIQPEKRVGQNEKIVDWLVVNFANTKKLLPPVDTQNKLSNLEFANQNKNNNNNAHCAENNNSPICIHVYCH